MDLERAERVFHHPGDGRDALIGEWHRRPPKGLDNGSIGSGPKAVIELRWTGAVVDGDLVVSIDFAHEGDIAEPHEHPLEAFAAQVATQADHTRGNVDWRDGVAA